MKIKNIIMRISAIFFLLILFQAYNILFAGNPKVININQIADNQFSYSLETNDTMVGKPGDVIQFVARFRNLTHNDVYIIIKRTGQDLPPKWKSQYCAGNCFPPEVDSSSLYLSPEDTQDFNQDFQTNEIEGEGSATFTFVSKDNPDNKFTQTFYAITSNKTDVSEIDYSGIKLEVFPNPVNHESVVSCRLSSVGYQLSAISKIKLSIYNFLGDEVVMLYDGNIDSGQFNYQFSIVNYQLSNGSYFLKLETTSKIFVKPIIIIRN